MTETTDTTQTPGQGEGGEEQLGDAGKRALDRMKEERNDARTALKAFQDLGLPADELGEIVKKHTETDQEAALAQARQEGAQEARKTFEQQLTALAVRERAAAKGFHEPEAALLFLGDRVSEITVTDEGVDTSSVDTLLDDVATNHQYLVRQKDEGSGSSFGLGAQSALPLNGDGIEHALKTKLGIK
ncbi:hypothetical protein [Gulosibacter sp. 10]|uniref:hypothetical protein n=1 Tax=Gulosibacter sp. 10 TaxID=1255570 RepID=UPI00097F39C0|nr:hypothetical protein [Gulosibacter sp. 10]SJM61352.1 hypothetical protein FM112_07810 [Gulosibacter sp. 10]